MKVKITQEDAKGMFKKLSDKTIRLVPLGGVRFPVSDCCGAPFNVTTGGVRLEICSKCGKLNIPRKY